MTQEFKNNLIYLLIKIAFCVGLVLITFTFLFGLMRVPDNSMSPAFKAGDLILYNRLEHTFQAKDCVVINQQGTQAVRIIAIPGERVDLTKDGLQVNGYKVSEQDIHGQTLPYKEGIKFPLTVPAHHYFVLCDTRPQAKDSRLYGCVSEKKIKGAVISALRRKNF